MSNVTDQIKTYAKNKIKKELFKIVLKLLKKLLAKAIAVIAKLLVALAGVLGVKGILVILVIILVGGMVMYIMPFFGWYEGSDSPKTPEELTAEYVQAYESTSSNESYRPPQLLIQFIDSVKILKDKKDLWEIDPNRIAKVLKADITTSKFKTSSTTTEVTTYKDSDKEPSQTTSTTSSDVELVTYVHAWNRIEEITYQETESYYSYESTDASGNKNHVSVYSTTWTESSRKSTMNFSKLDELLTDLRFSSSDFDLLVQTIIANDKDYLDGYDGQYGMHYGDDVSWWDGEEGEYDGSWVWPTVSTRITSGFYIRTHPVTGEIAMHNGIDIGRPIINGKHDERAQPIISVAKGKVTHAGTKGTYGIAVYVDHGNGLVTIYGHLKSVDKKIKVGTEVDAGTTLGIMGSTGRSTGIHLHFTVVNNGKFDNPLKYVKPPSG